MEREIKAFFYLFFIVRVTVKNQKGDTMNPQYKKLESETDYEYGLRLISIKVEEKPDDLDWEDIVKLLNLDCHRDSLRKAANVTDFSGYRVMQYFKEKLQSQNCDDTESYINELDEKKRQLIKERAKLHTEKLEYNRWLREDARDELFEEKVIAAIKENLNKIDPPQKIGGFHTSRFGLLNIADCHFGKDFKIYGLDNRIINAYSPDIFFMRMETLYNEVVDYAHKENLTGFKIFNLGDALEDFSEIHSSGLSDMELQKVQLFSENIWENGYALYLKNLLLNIIKHVEIMENLGYLMEEKANIFMIISKWLQERLFA